MDPAQFGLSTIPLQHVRYEAIAPDSLRNSITGKVAVVTGAGRGIGAAIAESLAKSGADVAIFDLTTGNLKDTKKACEECGVRVKTIACDVADASQVKAALDQVETQLRPIVISVNNAGILEQRPFLMATFESFWKQIEVNFKAPLMLIHEVLPRMRDRRAGCIINIASRSGTVDVAMTLGYVTSKAALIRATHTLQKEMELDGLDPDIHMYALHPGGVLTAMGGSSAVKDVKEKYGDVSDEDFFKDLFKDTPALCAQACAFLASGRGKELRGLYLDCRQDVSKLIELGRETLIKENRNTLTVNFIDGYANEP